MKTLSLAIRILSAAIRIPSALVWRLETIRCRWQTERDHAAAERRMGELLRETERADGGDAQRRTRSHGVTESPPTLAELGITKNESTRLVLPFKTVEKEFESETHVVLWIRTNQLGRRNLTDDQRAMIADAVAEIESKLAMQERGKAGGKAGGVGRPKGDSLEAAASAKLSKPKDKTRAKIAKAEKVSERKMKKARAIRKKSPTLAAKVEAGELTLDAAAKEIRTAEIVALETGVSPATIKRDGKLAEPLTPMACPRCHALYGAPPGWPPAPCPSCKRETLKPQTNHHHG